MFGVPLSGPARIFCDNESVVINSSHPDSVLKKKHCSIGYHKVREAIAAHKQLVHYEKTDNFSRLIDKTTTSSKAIAVDRCNTFLVFVFQSAPFIFYDGIKLKRVNK